MISRREFLKRSGLLAGALAMPTIGPHSQPTEIEDESHEVVPRPSISASSIANFADPLPIPQVAKPSGEHPDPFNPGQRVPFYRIEMSEVFAKLHRDLKPTRIWAYGGTSPGPIIEARVVIR